MIIKDKGLLLGLLLFLIVVGLLVFREVQLSWQAQDTTNTINQLYPSESTSAGTPTLRSTDPLIGQGSKQMFFYGDFSCLACKAQWQLLRSFQAANPKAISIVWKDMVDVTEPESFNAAAAARCAGSGFGSYADQLFANNDKLGQAEYLILAKQLNLNQADFAKCQSGSQVNSLIQADVQEAIHLGLNQTPVVYVNNQWYFGGLSQSELANLAR